MPLDIDFTQHRPRGAEDLVREEAARQSVDPGLAAAVAHRESDFQQGAVSPKGAVGVMQLMPSTAAGLGVNPSDITQNIRGGVSYLRQMLDKFNGDVPTALAAYNAGPTAVQSGRPLPQETQDYIKAVTSEVNPRSDFASDFISSRGSGSSSEPLPSAPPRKEQRPGFLTRSVFETATGTGASQAYENVLPRLKSILPESMRGQYATELAAEVSKAGPEFVDFLTSPVGLGLAAAHFFPATAPFAAMADIGLGGYQALKAIPDVADAVLHLDDPHKVGRAIVDVIGAYAGLKGGTKLAGALRRVPAETAAGKPLVTAIADAYHTAPPPPAPAGELRRALEAAEPEDRPAIVEAAAQPQNLREAAEKKLYATPYVRGITNVLLPRVKQPPLLDLAQTLVDERAGFIASEWNRVRRVADEIRRTVPEEEQNIRNLGYAMEGDLPESSLSAAGQQALVKLRELNREREERMRQTYGDDLRLLNTDSYIRHYWDFSGINEKAKYGVAARMMRDPSLRSRTIGTLKHGIENEGLTPLYENVTDVVTRRHMEAVRSMANQEFANTLSDYGLIVSPDKARALGATQWHRAVDAPALRKAAYSGTTPSGDAIFNYQAPLVHPDIEMAVNAIFKEPLRFPGMGAMEQLRAFSKQMKVGYSLFHNNALSEVSQAEGAGLGKPLRALRALAWPFDPDFVKGVRNSIWEVRGKVAPEAPPDVSLRREAIESWLKANMQFSSSEQEAAAVRAAMNLWKNKGPVLKALGAPIRGLGNVQYVFNRALFDYYLPGQMLHSAEGIFAREMNRLGPNPHPGQVFALRREIADHTNRAYGADNLERLLLSPRAKQALAFTFFAPMWTISNLRVLSKGFESTTGARITGRYAAGAALTYFLTAQLANYASTSWWNMEDKDGKKGGHWTWDNPGDPFKVAGSYVPGVTDNAANIAFGYNADGSQRYIRLGKAYREPFMWMVDPLKTFGGKMSMPLKQAIVQLSGHEPGTGFTAINPKLRPEDQMQQRLAEVGELFTPFAAQTGVEWAEHKLSPTVFRERGSSSQMFGLPARKGTTFEASVVDLREAIESNRMDLAQQILGNAALNKISPKSVIREVSSRIRSETRTSVGLPKTHPPPVATENPPEPTGSFAEQGAGR